MELWKIVKYAISLRASDIHITVGSPPVLRIDGNLIKIDGDELEPKDIDKFIKQILDETQQNMLKKYGEIDIHFSDSSISYENRFRINAYKQKSYYAMALRILNTRIPTAEELGLPLVVNKLVNLPKGLILVTGPSGSGKSTTLASIINLINENRRCHILTLEDPIEYIHKHNKSIVNQREIGSDSQSFSKALRAALRQDPDVILVGEMRDLETISIVLTAAETGHLVFSTLHTIGAAKTVDRIIDVFPPYQQQQIRVQFSSVLQAVISQQLLPKIDGKGRVAAFEIMIVNPAIRNLIRENKTHQIDNIIQTSGKLGMQTIENSLTKLFNKGIIARETIINQNAINNYTFKKGDNYDYI